MKMSHHGSIRVVKTETLEVICHTKYLSSSEEFF